MIRNVGKIDGTIRLAISLVVAALGIYYNSWWGWLAILPFLTAFASFCPLYKLLGISTCKQPKKNTS